MQVALDNHIYCSTLFDVLSLEGLMAAATECRVPLDFPVPHHCDDCLKREGSARILHDRIDNLPPQQRRVILSVFFDDMTPASTACHLGITDAAVSKLKAKALKRLLHGLAPRRGELLI